MKYTQILKESKRWEYLQSELPEYDLLTHEMALELATYIRLAVRRAKQGDFEETTNLVADILTISMAFSTVCRVLNRESIMSLDETYEVQELIKKIWIKR